MKKYVYALAMLLIFHIAAQAEGNWTKLSCVQENTKNNLLFIPEQSGNEGQRCTFFDGQIAWNMLEIMAQGDFYRVKLHPGCRHVSAGSLSSIEWRMPPDRRIRATGPFSFSINLVGKNSEGKRLFTESYSCAAIQ